MDPRSGLGRQPHFFEKNKHKCLTTIELLCYRSFTMNNIASKLITRIKAGSFKPAADAFAIDPRSH